MAYRIRLETDNQTRPGFNEVAAGIQNLGNAAGITTNAAKDLNKELDKRRYAEYRAAVKAAADELDTATMAKKRAGEAAKKLAEDERNQAQASREAEGKRRQGIQATVDAYHVLKDAVKFVGEQIRQAAEEGNENARKMVEAFDGLGPKLREIAFQGDAMRHVMESFGEGGATKGIEDAAKAVDHYFATAQNNAKLFAADMMAITGIIDEQTHKLEEQKILGDMSDEARKRREDEAFHLKHLNAVQQGEQAVMDVRVEFIRRQERREQEKRAADAQDLEFEAELLLAIGKREEKIQDAANALGLSEKERNAIIREEQQELRRLLELQEKRAEATKKAGEAEAEIAKQNAETMDEMERRMIEAAEEGARQRLKLMRDEAAAQANLRRQQIDDVADAGGRNAANQVIDRLDPRKVREQYARQAMQRTAANIDSGNFGDYTPGQRQKMIQESRVEAFKQFNRGQADPSEMVEATKNAAAEQMKTGRGTNQTMGKAAQTMGAIVNEQIEQRAEQAQLREQFQQIQNMLKQSGTNSRRRGQQGPG